MPKAKHTPGPWRLGYIEESGRPEKFPAVYSEPAKETIVLINNEADGKLIAAAPEMLEALESIENDNNIIPAPIWELRNKAIKKARGE